jgi:hypothetical protein
MAIGRISGQMLKANLLRSGTDLAFETNLLALDVTNSRIGIGTASPSRQLHINGTGAIRLPGGTSAERGTPAAGDVRYNSDTGQIEGYTTDWFAMTGGSSLTDVDGNTGISVERTSDENEIHFFTETSGDVLHIRDNGNIELNNLQIADTTISSLTTNGDINITPNGTGQTVIKNLSVTDGLDLGDLNALNVGDMNVDSVSSDNGTDFDLLLDDNQATALEIKEGSNNYITFVTTDGSEEITVDKKMVVSTGVTFETDTADINGGAIDGTTIGANTAAAGTFTDVTATNVQATNIKANDGTAAMTIADSTGNVDVSTNLTVGGDLTVNGTTTTIDSTTLVIEDPLIQLAKNNSGGAANAFDQGLFFNRGSLDNVSFLWDESADQFAFAVTSSEDGTTAGNVTIDSYASLRANVATFVDTETGTVSAADGTLSMTIADSTGAVTFNAAPSFGDNNITNVGDIALDTISADGTTIGITLTDNTAAALDIKEGANSYLKFDTTNSSELITAGEAFTVATGKTFTTDTADINGGAIDGTTIGANTAAAGTFTTATATSVNATNVRANDGTAAIVLTDSTGAVAISTALTATGNVSVDGGTFIFNETGADLDFRFEGDADANLLFGDAGNDRIGIGTNTPGYSLDIGSKTDAVLLPVGDTSERPTASTGIIRFNSQTGKYEGCQDGSTYVSFQTEGDTPIISKVSTTGDGSTTTFSGFFASAPASAANVLVFIDNVYQEPTENYSVSGTNITFTSAPHSGARIFAIVGFDNTAAGSGGVVRTETTATNFTSSATTIMSFNATTYRSAEAFITTTDTDNTEYEVAKALIVHDGSSAYITVYGQTSSTGSDLSTYTATVSGGSVLLQAVSSGGQQSAKVQYSLTSA